jgi:hypothetical protein
MTSFICASGDRSELSILLCRAHTPESCNAVSRLVIGFWYPVISRTLLGSFEFLQARQSPNTRIIHNEKTPGSARHVRFSLMLRLLSSGKTNKFALYRPASFITEDI